MGLRLSPRAAALLLPALLAASPGAFAHSTDEVPTLATAWSATPWVWGPMIALVLLYAAGIVRLWRRAGTGRGLGAGTVLAFAGGMLALALATLWPLDALGEWSLAAHMAQHVLLLALVPPLLLVARPGVVLAGLFPALARALNRGLGGALRRALAALAPATAVHVAVMWAWHVPAALAAALADDAVHWSMHGSFLLAGAWFWAAALHRLRDPAAGVGPALVALVAVMMQMGLMGALLTFAPRPLYAHYLEHAPALGLTPLADQQLAGLLMWVPACLPYLLAAGWLAWHGLGRDGARPSHPG